MNVSLVIIASLTLLIPPAIAAQDEEASQPSIEFGGAIRLNYTWKDYDEQVQDRFGDFAFELFRIDVNGQYDVLDFSAQYRLYQDFDAVHHAFIGYDVNESWKLELGINQVPFGILPAASHSFWFGGTYYMGFEDDYDTGLKALYEKGPISFQAAFYKNAEYLDTGRSGRYSFDLVTGGDQANTETNQGNLRLAYELKSSGGVSGRVGVSGELGGIYNQTTMNMGRRWAVAGHADFHIGNWNLQLQGIEYRFNPENPPGVDRSTVQLGAFAFPFLMASEGKVLTANVARDIEVDWRVLDSARCYGNWTGIFPRGGGSNSTQLVTGCLLMKEGLYTYVDVITGRNMWFAGGPGIGLDGPDADVWNSRLNINMGFYF